MTLPTAVHQAKSAVMLLWPAATLTVHGSFLVIGSLGFSTLQLIIWVSSSFEIGLGESAIGRVTCWLVFMDVYFSDFCNFILLIYWSASEELMKSRCSVTDSPSES